MIALGAGILAIVLIAGVAITALARTTDDPQPANAAAEVSETEKPDEEDDKGDKGEKEGKDEKGEKDAAKKKDSEKDDEKKSDTKDADKKDKVKTSTPKTKSPSSGSSKSGGSSGSTKKSSTKTSSSTTKEKSSKSAEARKKSSTPATSSVPSEMPSTSAAEDSHSTPPTNETIASTSPELTDDFRVTSAEPSVDELDALVQYLVTTDAPDEAKAQSLDNGMAGVGITQFLAGLGVGEDPQGEASVLGPLERSGDAVTATLEYDAEGQTRLSTPVVFVFEDGAWKLSAETACAAAEGAGAPVGC